MRTVVVHNGARIPLGKQGENNAVRVVWPGIAEKYAKLYGDGRFELVVVQNGKVYPAVVNVDGADLIWNVLAADVAIAEIGSLELIYYVGDTIAKSQTWETFVEVSKSAEGTTEPPEPAKNWVDVVIKTASDAKQSATESAESARQSAESATNAAASATKAENAVGHSPIVGENGNWFVWDFTKSEYVDSGKPASTPPITPDTAGKYLTNNGRKAEWGARVVENIEHFDTNELLRIASSNVTAIVKEEGNANSGDMVFPVIAQLDGIVEHGRGFMSYLDAHGDHYVGGFSLVGGAVGVPKLAFSNTTLYVTITPDGQDSDGNPICKSDKTYEEIKAAYEAGREVKIARAGIFDTEIFYTLGLVDIPLLTIGNDESPMGEVAIFGSVGTPFPDLQKVTETGGQCITILDIIIQADGQVHVDSSIDFATGKWVPFAINKLPQQYIINVTEGTDGTMAADWTYEEIQNVINAYETNNGGTAVFSAKFDKELYVMCGDSLGLERFVFRNMSDLSKTMTLSKDNVWNADNRPLDTPFFIVNKKDDGSYYITDENRKEINPQSIPIGNGIHPFIYYGGYNYLLYTLPEYATVSFICFKDQIGGFKYSVIDINRRYGTVAVQDWKPICPNQTPEVTTADNGKFLRVVDGQWAADAAGGETWEKITEIVIPEGTDESTALTINKDSDGNPFSLVKARLCAKFPKYTGATTIPNFSFAMLNGKTTGKVTPLAYTSVWPKVSASIVTGTVYEIDVSGAQQIEHVIKSGNGGWTDDSIRDYTMYGATPDTDTTWLADTLWAKPITSIGGTNMLIYPGCRFVLYGVRA